MSYALIEALLLTLVLAGALWNLFGRLAPATRAQLQKQVGEWLARDARPALLRRAGSRIIPRSAPAACGDGCSRCGACPVGSAASDH